VTRRVRTAYLTVSFEIFDMADVEMKDAKSKVDAKDDIATPPLSPVSEIKSNVTLIERAISTLEPRFTIRVLRSLTALLKRLDDKALCDAVSLKVCGRGFSVLINCRFSGQVVSALMAPRFTCSRRVHGSRLLSFA
jgi:hypothetical protein